MRSCVCLPCSKVSHLSRRWLRVANGRLDRWARCRTLAAVACAQVTASLCSVLVSVLVGGRRSDNVVLVTERLRCEVHNITCLLQICHFILGSIASAVDWGIYCRSTLHMWKFCLPTESHLIWVKSFLTTHHKCSLFLSTALGFFWLTLCTIWWQTQLIAAICCQTWDTAATLSPWKWGNP